MPTGAEVAQYKTFDISSWGIKPLALRQLKRIKGTMDINWSLGRLESLPSPSPPPLFRNARRNDLHNVRLMLIRTFTGARTIPLRNWNSRRIRLMTLRQIIRLRSIAFCLVCHHNMLFPPAHSKGCKIREFSFQSNFPFVYTLFPCTVIIPLKRCASVFLPLFLSQNSRWFLFFLHNIFSSNNYLFKLSFLLHLSIYFLLFF